MSAPDLFESVTELAGECRRFQHKLSKLSQINDSVIKFTSHFGPLVDALAVSSSTVEFEAMAARVQRAAAEAAAPASGVSTAGRDGVHSTVAGAPHTPGQTQRRGGKTPRGQLVPDALASAAAAITRTVSLKKLVAKMPAKFKRQDHVVKMEFIVRYLLLNREAGASLAQVVRKVGVSVIQCNEYLTTLIKLGEITRKKERKGLQYYPHPARYPQSAPSATTAAPPSAPSTARPAAAAQKRHR